MGLCFFVEKNMVNYIKGIIVKVVDLIFWMLFSLIEFFLRDYF